ncbi:MAG: rhamnogalacturonan acetylesterase [Candidatus Pedobacter colombiensis]|uniref:Rhamnogalacturonan acetylesterase n=1 Tax=Candidatus Pedobacter colombiensis TaxID=3121371 RepID=A0AAJ6B9K2_9SPHI|nr:rhamnogalacturonan acetylesterase [Pedobacter sp.]WEK20283.1 MAG: rhamnogalacturonan acetylesterase [Pedobacter sp.]
MSLFNKLRFAAFFSVILLMSFMTPAKKIKVYLVGDSTMSVKLISKYPETGWGMPFAIFFDESVTVDNRAQNGRSTKSFITEGRWKSVTDSLNAGDYVFIQFGHNDEVKTKKTYTTEDEFKTNLEKYVSETLKVRAFPILITPVARRSFDANGNVQESHQVYSEIVRNVAGKMNVPLIDLDKESMALLQKMGVENSKLLFNKLEPGQHPNYPAGVDDNTHFNEYGARRMAELVLAELKKLNLELAARVVKR